MSGSFVSRAVPAEITQSLITQSTQKDTHTSDHIHDGGVVCHRQARLVPAEVQAKIDSGSMKLQHWTRTRTQSSGRRRQERNIHQFIQSVEERGADKTKQARIAMRSQMASYAQPAAPNLPIEDYWLDNVIRKHARELLVWLVRLIFSVGHLNSESELIVSRSRSRLVHKEGNV